MSTIRTRWSAVLCQEVSQTLNATLMRISSGSRPQHQSSSQNGKITSLNGVSVMGVSISSRGCVNKLFIIMHWSVLSTRYGFGKSTDIVSALVSTKHVSNNSFSLSPFHLYHSVRSQHSSIPFNRFKFTAAAEPCKSILCFLCRMCSVLLLKVRASVLYTFFNGHPSAEWDRVSFALATFAAHRPEWK